MLDVEIKTAIRLSMNITRGEITVGRFLIPYRLFGQGSRFLVCVNGAQQTMAAWRPVVNYFSRDYRLLLFDFPGQGRAQIISGSAVVALDEQVEVLHQVLSAQNAPEKSIVAGASWGGVVVAAFASRFPHLVDKIILASFGIRVNEKLVQAIREGQQLNGTATGEQVAGVIIKYFGQHLNEAFKKKMYDQFKNIKKEHLENFHAHGQLLENTKHINEVVDLHSIRAQTLIINGEMDTVMDLDDIALAAAQIANCVVKIVPGVGHFLHNESDDVLGIYRDFLSLPSERQLS
jgi:pimeloyl-ACP methyl ester carboxylesterase